MLEQLEQIKAEAQAALEKVSDLDALEAWRVAHLGRSSPLMNSFKQMGGLSKEERPKVGQRANEVKVALEAELETKRAMLKQAALSASLDEEQLDVTLPGRALVRGRLHPITQTLRRIYAIFAEMGFQVYRSREVESDDYNFTFLNMPPHHPARDMWDTFYTSTEGVILRTHTSPGQIHAMREFHPDPIRVILPGMCYRYEQVTTRSEMQFTQVEGLAVGKHITLSDLKGTLTDFARRLFDDPNVGTRFRASHFPFTEPSAEMDVECFVCGGKGCSVCKQTGWLEILGSGMVHPTVLRYGGYDPEEYSGYAFGMGPERITMLLHRIDDIRYFWRNDLRFLEQF
ncbi:MAG: phenylalanine--tRNA ligase subunit alpha [Chloroflexi bacterium]|nr:MAG: phenylalanine--tRNA ligase subunit alpha [Chloroflexota bacterium]MBL1196981.1 phenylalanine--tRNA ligase subunit alpha [Chloroflexota bacterium]NOH14276.1 phenylalanine--tRNA ligase subunit alpha [Chloroflexota bacterium]